MKVDIHVRVSTSKNGWLVVLGGDGGFIIRLISGSGLVRGKYVDGGEVLSFACAIEEIANPRIRGLALLAQEIWAAEYPDPA